MMEWLLLLLPVAAASGWYAAKRSERRTVEGRRWPDPGYFKGLNYLLNEQPDKAIDVFTRLLEVDHETVETHLALGNLFRRRGEVDRAIRIHQNLVARDNLTIEQRALALLELGQDHLRAGLFDRAEDLFSELAESPLYREQALQNLRAIYEQEKDWERCLEVADRQQRLSGQSLATERAHYYCEMSEAALRKGAEPEARALLDRALTSDPGCVRAGILQARMARRAGDCARVLTILTELEAFSPAFLPEWIPDLERCYRELGQPERLRDYLDAVYAKRGGVAAMLARAEIHLAESGPQAAADFIARHLRQHPSLLGLKRLMELEIADRAEIPAETRSAVSAMLAYLVEHWSGYQCQRCGFHARELHWQCPGCKAWSSVQPVETLAACKTP